MAGAAAAPPGLPLPSPPSASPSRGCRSGGPVRPVWAAPPGSGLGGAAACRSVRPSHGTPAPADPAPRGAWSSRAAAAAGLPRGWGASGSITTGSTVGSAPLPHPSPASRRGQRDDPAASKSGEQNCPSLRVAPRPRPLRELPLSAPSRPPPRKGPVSGGPRHVPLREPSPDPTLDPRLPPRLSVPSPASSPVSAGNSGLFDRHVGSPCLGQPALGAGGAVRREMPLGLWISLFPRVRDTPGSFWEGWSRSPFSVTPLRLADFQEHHRSMTLPSKDPFTTGKGSGFPGGEGSPLALPSPLFLYPLVSLSSPADW